MELKGSHTEKNLLTAFAGESQARNRYTYFAGQARKEGYIQVALIFEETADQEKEHGKRFFKFLQGGDAEINAVFPAGIIGDTRHNLQAAAAGEGMEWSEIYPSFSQTARQEGFDEIAAVFEAVAVAEKQHGRRFHELQENIQKGLVFRRDEPVTWRCLNCGYIHLGREAPRECPACAHPQSYYELLAKNW
jgi:rubrerythrin